jgi:hypothetical protein
MNLTAQQLVPMNHQITPPFPFWTMKGSEIIPRLLGVTSVYPDLDPDLSPSSGVWK